MVKGKSLVLVTVDCLRADHVGFLGYPEATSPFLDGLARESIVFPSTIAAGTPTYFSFPAILASRFPFALGRDIVGLTPKESTLAAVLQNGGHTTAAFLAGNAYLSARLHYDQGFDFFNDFLPSCGNPSLRPKAERWFTRLNNKLESSSKQSCAIQAIYEELYFRYCQLLARHRKDTMDILRPYPAADALVDQARAWISGLGDQPFFLWIHFMDCHNPYYPPEKALKAIGSDLTVNNARFLNSFWKRSTVGERRLQRHRNDIINLYDAGVRWVDMQIARLVDVLRLFGRWDETVFAVTADHGEEFLEHHRRYHSTEDLPEELIHVPLLMRVPGAKPVRLPNTAFSHIDLAPTLLDIMGIPIPATFQGTSRWPEISRGSLPVRPVVTESLHGCTNPIHAHDRLRPRLLAVREGPFKLVVRFRQQTESLYNLDNDPYERASLSPTQHVAVRRRLFEFARQHLQRTNRCADLELQVRARVREFLHTVISSPAKFAVGQN
jgi:arylsulfatase A-like enzyme